MKILRFCIFGFYLMIIVFSSMFIYQAIVFFIDRHLDQIEAVDQGLSAPPQLQDQKIAQESLKAEIKCAQELKKLAKAIKINLRIKLMKACESGNLEKVKHLVEHCGADIHDDGVALGFAVKKGHIEVVKYLIEKVGSNK